MDDVRRLSRHDILSGTRKEYPYFLEELGGEVILHPLTDGQWASVNALKVGGGKMAGEPVIGADGQVDPVASSANMRVEVDLSQSVRDEYEADCLAVAYSLSGSGDAWSVADVKGMRPAGVVKKISKKVYAISGVDKAAAEWVSSFREDGGRPADSSTTLVGLSSGADARCSDTVTENIPGVCFADSGSGDTQ